MPDQAGLASWNACGDTTVHVQAEETKAKPAEEMTDDELKALLPGKGVTIVSESRDDLIKLAQAV